MREIKLKGEWWLPKRSKKVRGELYYSPEKGAILDLNGFFFPPGYKINYKDFRKIFGVSSKDKLITIDKAVLLKKNESKKGYQVAQIKGVDLFIGDYLIKDQESFKVYSANTTVNLISFWLDRPPRFKTRSLTSKKKFKKYEISYEMPEPIKYFINYKNYEIELQFEYAFVSEGRIEGIFKLEEIPEITLRFKKKISLPEVNKIIEILRTFLSFATSERIVILKTNFFKYKKDKIPIEYYYTLREKITYPTYKKKEYMLFTYDDVEENFEDVIKKWFKLYEELQLGFLNRLSFYESIDPINRFLSIIKRLELYYSLRKNGFLIDEKKYKEEILPKLLSIILQFYSTDEAKRKQNLWKKRLESLNYPSLRNILKDLFKEYEDILVQTGILKSDEIKNFAHECYISRNYYTHFKREGRNKILKDWELVIAAEKLRILLEAILLKELGLNKNEFIIDAINRVKNFRILKV